MFKRSRLALACVCTLGAAPLASADPIVSFADSLVTWQASGVIESAEATDGIPVPPVGTRYTVTLSFNPSTAFPTFTGTGPVANCQTVNATGSLAIGGTSLNLGGQGFTHSQVLDWGPCVGSTGGFTEFLMGITPTDESPWDLPPMILLASYRDLFEQDTFPEVPTGVGDLMMLSGVYPQNFLWRMDGVFAPVALEVQQPTPVPEPATLTMFGAGLAALVARRRQRRRH